MLEILILIFVGRYFYKFSKDNNMKPVLWTIIGVLSYFVGAFVMGLIVGILNPRILDNLLTLTLLGLVSGLIGVTITFFIMKAQAKNTTPSSESEVLDDSL